MAEEQHAAHGAEQRWVSVAEAARALGVTERAVRGRVARGTITSREEVLGNHKRQRILLTLPRHDPHAERHAHDLRAEAAEARAIAERLRALLQEKDARIEDLQRERDKLIALVERALERNQREQAEREARPRRRWWWWRGGE